MYRRSGIIKDISLVLGLAAMFCYIFLAKNDFDRVIIFLSVRDLQLLFVLVHQSKVPQRVDFLLRDVPEFLVTIPVYQFLVNCYCLLCISAFVFFREVLTT